MSPAAKSAELNPRTTSYEFLGPPGALFVTLTVPFFTYALYFGCSESAGCPPNIRTIPDQLVASLSNLDWWKGLWDTQAALMYLAWYAFCIVAWAVLPGDHVEGTMMRNGQKKKYKINGAQRVILMRSRPFSRCMQPFPRSCSHWASPLASFTVTVPSRSLFYTRNG